MALTVTVTPGYVWQVGELVTQAKLNLAANPIVNLSGSVSTLTLADGSVTTSKLADGVLSADSAGRPKMASGYIINTHFSSGALSADSTGRAAMADGFLTPWKRVAATTPGTSGSVTLDWSTTDKFQMQLTGNITFTFTGGKDGEVVTVAIKQAAAGGPYTVTWPGGVNWGPAGAPTMTSTASKTDYYCFIQNFAGAQIAGFYRQNF